MKRALFYAKSEDGQLVFANKRQMGEFLHLNNNKEFEVYIRRVTKMRTGQQNNALHLYLQLLANELNAAGYTVQLVLKEKIDLDWTLESAKELLWRPAQKAITGKSSSTELDKVEDIDAVYEHLNRHISEKFGVFVPFPSENNNPTI